VTNVDETFDPSDMTTETNEVQEGNMENLFNVYGSETETDESGKPSPPTTKMDMNTVTLTYVILSYTYCYNSWCIYRSVI